MLTILLFCFLVFKTGSAQTIFSVDSKYDADIKVYVTDSKYNADLIVFKCSS